jgi:hypothetical protein
LAIHIHRESGDGGTYGGQDAFGEAVCCWVERG